MRVEQSQTTRSARGQRRRAILATAAWALTLVGIVGVLVDTVSTAAAEFGSSLAEETPRAIETQPAPRAQASQPPPTVILYGDSLAFSARDYFVWTATTNGWNPLTRVFGGTAPCDWHEPLLADLEVYPNAVVIVAFSGNAFTECMLDPATGAGLTGADVVDKYRVDVAAFALTATASGGSSILVGAPISANGVTEIHDVFRQVAEKTPQSIYLDGGSTIAPGGVYTPTMPCRPDEDAVLGCRNGRIRVRAEDGAHFCPTDHVADAGRLPECPVYSSGARRYGELMAAALGPARGHEPTNGLGGQS